jgi:serine/threonine-protein kinase
LNQARVTPLTVVPPLTAQASLSMGETLGVYVLEQVLGEGSMGTVYLGRHQRLGRQVALKVLHEHLLRDQRLVKRFMQEGRVVNQINHEHIVEVHDFVEELAPERVYCVMELLKGETLSQRLATRAVNLESVRTIGRQIASALGAAHAVGVVHRDVKPENIFLLSRDGRDDWVKVLDFGIAKSDQNTVNLVESQQGTLLGTPRYMAPEQVAGLEVDARTDVYALGTILYELLAGKPPFEASTFGQLAADIITRAPPPLPKQNTLGESIPVGLQALVYACLAKQPKDRPASMGAVEAQLLSEDSAFRGVALAAPAPAAVVVAPPPPPPAETEVTLAIDTHPAGAKVVRIDTGEVLGVAPFEKKLARADLLPVRIELPGYVSLERELRLDQSQRVDMTLTAVPPKVVKPAPRPVTDGVLDPY